MNLLLDTCTLIWAIYSAPQLSVLSRKQIADRTNSIFVSAASAWEIATKVRRGRLPEAVELERNFLGDLANAGYILLPIDATVALRAGRLTADHRDPFDRMIAAQALSLDIPILSPDPHFDQFGVRRIWS